MYGDFFRNLNLKCVFFNFFSHSILFACLISPIELGHETKKIEQGKMQSDFLFEISTF